MVSSKALEEFRWLQANPAFEERPAVLTEFLGDEYLNIEELVRKRIREVLADIMGHTLDPTRMTQYERALVTGGIGLGKTTIASIILPYMAHWVLCLKDPQRFFHLLPGSRIAFMQMSTSETQAKEVVFGDIDARIKYSPWFSQKYPKDPSFKNQIRFPKEIWILPGDSAETTFEGYNILGGILDEADSHKVTKDKDYANVGYETISSRIESRFGNQGFLLVIGQKKRANGFVQAKHEEFKEDPHAYVVTMPIWESLGWEKWTDPKTGERDSFFYDTRRKLIVPPIAAKLIENTNLIEVPNTYIQSFKNNPEKALRDLAGIPPATGDPFISLVDRIDQARDRWNERYDNFGSPVGPEPIRPKFATWFEAREKLKRVVHIDLAYSSNGDALGIAMGHVPEVVNIDGETKPYIVFDMLLRMKAPAGGEILLAEVRHLIYYLRDDLKFNIQKVTLDGFQSTDTIQQLQKRRFGVELLSVDKQKLPYEDLREALYESRIEFPPYVTYLQPGDTKQVEIAVKELQELTDNGKKIDHPENGSKDVTDAMAGVIYTLMGDRRYRRNIIDMSERRGQQLQKEAVGQSAGFSHPALGSLLDISAPVPPSFDDPRWRKS